MRQKVLLIDESAMLRRIVASVLHAQPARYEVVVATRASEGFAQACGHGVELILADYRIAGSEGLEFCRRLLQEPRTALLPVVLLVGRGLPVPDREGWPDNVIETLGKPFAPLQLAGLVNTLFGFAKAGVSLRELRARLCPAASAAAVPPPPSFRVQEPTVPPSLRTAPLAEPVRSGDPSGVWPGVEAGPFGQAKLLKASSLRSVLRAVAATSGTGVLRFKRQARETTDVYLEEGRLLAVSTRDAQTYSEGAAPLLPARVSPSTLEAAVDEQARTGVPFLLNLGTHGLLSKAAAVALLQRFGQRHFARSWALPPKVVEFAFEPLEMLPPFALRLDAAPEPLDAWLLASLRLLGAADVAADARHEGHVGTPFWLPGGEVSLHALGLTEPERNLASGVDGRRDLPTLARASGLSTADAYLLLYRFRCLEVMDYRPAPVAFVVTPRTSQRRALLLPR